jgi:eukaryotic-like serine/threonine-protein kinase
MAGLAAAPRFEPHNKVGGKFRLRRRIAAGGMGEVWVARNESTGADVALKVLRRGISPHDEELETEARFRHEARLAAMLSHRSIVKVFDLVEEPDGALILVMELLRGETLLRCLERRGPRSAREAVAILAPILGALGHAHDHGIVHRDVSPANIFLAVDPDGHVTPKLVDFGIAKLAAQPSGSPHPPSVKTVEGRVLGTPRYMAPERIRESAGIDGRADVFSVGVVLYETLTGVSPFAATTPSASLAAVLERHIDPDPRVEPKLWIELDRAISKQPYERHRTAQELAVALRAAVGETEGALEASLTRSQPPLGWDEEDAAGVVADPPPEGASQLIRAGRWRLPRSTWLVAGIATGVLLGVGVFTLRRASLPDPTEAVAPALSTLPPSLDSSSTPTLALSQAPAPPPATRRPAHALDKRACTARMDARWPTRICAVPRSKRNTRLIVGSASTPMRARSSPRASVTSSSSERASSPSPHAPPKNARTST